jgi:hypothetical protein
MKIRLFPETGSLVIELVNRASSSSDAVEVILMVILDKGEIQ